MSCLQSDLHTKCIYLQRVGSQLFHSHILNHDVNPSTGTSIINMYHQDTAYSLDSCSRLFMCGLYIKANMGVSEFPVPYQSLTLNLNPSTPSHTAAPGSAPVGRPLALGAAPWPEIYPPPPPPPQDLRCLCGPRGAMLSNPPHPPPPRGLWLSLTTRKQGPSPAPLDCNV